MINRIEEAFNKWKYNYKFDLITKEKPDGVLFKIESKRRHIDAKNNYPYITVKRFFKNSDVIDFNHIKFKNYNYDENNQ